MTRPIIRRTREQVYRRWIAALRSGEYCQGNGSLRPGSNEFCCLGVLCDLASKDGGPGWDERGHFMGRKAVLPEAVARFMNITEQMDLISLNDRGQTFHQIADYIESRVMPDAIAKATGAKQ